MRGLLGRLGSLWSLCLLACAGPALGQPLPLELLAPRADQATTTRETVNLLAPHDTGRCGTGRG